VQTIKALQALRHVVVDKPMALNLEEADKMIECAKRQKKILTAFHNRRYAPDYVKVKQIIDSGLIGEVVLIKMQWHNFCIIVNEPKIIY